MGTWILLKEAQNFRRSKCSCCKKYSKEKYIYARTESWNDRKACKHLSNVKIHQFEGLTVDFAKQIGCSTIIRGLRAVSDFESEMQMSLANKKLNDELETLFLVADGKYAFLSSSIVREIASYGADISELVPENIVEDIKRRFNDK